MSTINALFVELLMAICGIINDSLKQESLLILYLNMCSQNTTEIRRKKGKKKYIFHFMLRQSGVYKWTLE